MDASVSRDSLLLVVLGFSLAMAVVTAIVVAARLGRTPPGPMPVLASYPIEDPADRMKFGCLLALLLIAVFSILLALMAS